MPFERFTVLVTWTKFTTRRVSDDYFEPRVLHDFAFFFHLAHSLLSGSMLILVRPTTLNSDGTLKAALRSLRAKGIAVGGSWFVDADIVLKVDARDVQKATVVLTEAGFVAIVQSQDDPL